MAFVTLPYSPHAPGASPISIHYRDIGTGTALVFLHGGWGYGAYPIDRQLDELAKTARFIIPDRTGHGRSTRFSGQLPLDFHRRAAEETLLVLDALKIRRAIFWGHSDGAVIAIHIGLGAPERCARLVLEALHYDPNKPASRGFFQRFAQHPEEVSEKMHALLLADHGAEHWKKVVARNCRVWLKLAAARKGSNDDLYKGRLAELRVPVTLMHGRGDPRTEPGEIEQVRAALLNSDLHYLEEGRHSPHSERASWQECNEILRKVITRG
ncbi:MAG TPA: alpha/beta hydrolase [Candidatus Binatia bacterium]|nr:alpha/beta hydrolase [Candidatus Binatia bacterium]